MAERRPRILGQMLGQFVGKNVIILGRATKIGAGGNTAELTTFDNTKINISSQNPIEATPTDILEVWGNVKSRGTMAATLCVRFSQEHCVDFDQKAYSDLIIMQHAINERKWKINNSSPALV